MIDVALRTLLVQRSNIGERVAPGTDSAADKTLPRVVYTLIDDPRRYSDDGPVGLRKATYQLDVFARDLIEARSVQGQITAPANRVTAPGLDGFKGTVANTKIHRVYFGSDNVGRGAIDPGANKTIARASVDVRIDYRELLPQPNFTA